MTLDGFRDVTETPISLDFSNSWIADIRLNAGDRDGRTITVAITDNGQPITSTTGITSVALAYNTAPGVEVGDRVPMTPVSGQETATYRATLPRRAIAKPGVIVIFNWDGGVVDHIGFVEANHGSYIQTIEGNTNNGRVARRTRAWNTIAAILRPAYSGSATSSGGGTASSGGTGRLTVDGSCGPATIRRWQQVMGTSVDGIISGQYRPDGRTWGRPALVDSCVRYGGGGSNLIRAVQRKLSLTADGLLGPATIRALQKHLGVAQDSWFGPGTARALQSRLNTGRF